MNLSDEQKNKICAEILGTSGVGDEESAASYGITLEEMEEILGEQEIVQCGCCGWWVETSECDEYDGESEVCEDCRS